MKKPTKIRLSDNRYLSFVQYGDKNGKPLIYLHGTFSSRCEGQLSQEEAKKLGIKLICVDRPGYGHSTLSKNLTFKNYAQDIIELADKLEIQTFSILGNSGGSPYSCSVALQHPKRVKRLLLVSPIGDYMAWKFPPDLRYQLLGTTIKKRPNSVKPIIKAIHTIYENAPKQLYFYHVVNGSKPDTNYRRKEEFKKHFFETGGESFAKGIDGVLNDVQKFSKPWDINIKNIQVPTKIFCGAQDKTVPPIQSMMLHEYIKNSKLKVFEDGGHYIIFYKAAEIYKHVL